MMTKRRFRNTFFGGFLRREDGAVAVETVIILPMLFGVYLAIFSLYDAFSQYSLNQKAAYTIGDMISRQTVPIDDDYIDGAQDLFDYLTRSAEGSAIRVSSLRWNNKKSKFTSDWSKTRGWVSELKNKDVKTWADRLPVMKHNERIVLVETWSTYDPPFNTGLTSREIKNFIFTRPRYTDRVLFASTG